ncbi:hypothetical protein BH24DEI1_BH24DEI1_09920 [soil metagenome]|jgi:hypothetical protein
MKSFFRSTNFFLLLALALVQIVMLVWVLR